MRSRSYVLLLLLLGATGCAAPPPPTPRERFEARVYDGEAVAGWLRTELAGPATPAGYRVARDREARLVLATPRGGPCSHTVRWRLLELAALRAELERLLPVHPVPTHLTVVLARPEDHAGLIRWGRALERPAGVLACEDDRHDAEGFTGTYLRVARLAISADLGVTARHELVHFLHREDLSLRGVEHAPWFLEGLAECWDDVRLLAGTAVAGRRLFHEAREQILAGRWIPLGRLLRLERTAYYALPDARARYVQSAAVVRWLEERGLLGRFYRRHDAEGRDPGGASLLAQVSERPLDELDRTLRSWVLASATRARSAGYALDRRSGPESGGSWR